MRIGNPQHLEDALDDAIFAETSMQSVERDIRRECFENLGHVVIDIDTA